jgi:hypothetical protein
MSWTSDDLPVFWISWVFVQKRYLHNTLPPKPEAIQMISVLVPDAKTLARFAAPPWDGTLRTLAPT